MTFLILSRLTLLTLCVSLCGCFTRSPLPLCVEEKGVDTFGYRVWQNPVCEPDVIIIGIHGFCGNSLDYANLGNFLMESQPKTLVYAYELRGQGSDPIFSRRGDIGKSSDWYLDLEAFTQLVRARHPKAKIIWYGESMGALIATHALASAPKNDPPCDALVLSSPIVRFREETEPWKIALIQVAATTLPLARVPLESLTPKQDIQMTQGSNHMKQVEKNSYHIDKHTLRLLGTLTKLIKGMNRRAAKIEVPILVLHGQRDYFNQDSDIRGFLARIPPEVPMQYKSYPDAYHLLMYDEKREVIFKDVAKWLDQHRKQK